MAAVLIAAIALLVERPCAAEATGERVVVFVSPPAAELDEALRDALTAQLSGSGATVVFERFAAGGSLRSQVEEARSIAAAHSAVGVFWLDAQRQADWLLYLAEPGGSRVLVRRLEMAEGSDAAAVEAVAVITRGSTDALLAGQTIGMQPVELPPVELPQLPPAGERSPPAASPRPAPTPAHRIVHLSLGYHGDRPATQIAWQSGLHFEGALHTRLGPYLSIGYTLLKEVVVQSPDLVFRVGRSPVDVELGMRWALGRFHPSVAVRGDVDVIERRVESTAAGFSGSPDRTLLMWFVSPRVRLDYDLTPSLGVYLAGGPDLALNGFSFVSRADTGDRVLLSPLRVRPAAELGLTVTP